MNLDPGTLVGGLAFIFPDMLEDMNRDGPRASLAAALGSILVVFLTVGLGRFASATLFCGALGTTAVVAISATAGLKINFLDFVALPITIGIGIDYAVNMAARARRDGPAGMPWPPPPVPSSSVPIPLPLAMAPCYFPKIAASVPLDSQPWSVKSRVWSSPLW
jgi:hypothetical protein